MWLARAEYMCNQVMGHVWVSPGNPVGSTEWQCSLLIRSHEVFTRRYAKDVICPRCIDVVFFRRNVLLFKVMLSHG
jgi:hypothetical protein